MLSDLIEHASVASVNDVIRIVAMIETCDLDLLQLPNNNGEKLLFQALNQGPDCNGNIIRALVGRLCVNTDNFKNLNSSGNDIVEVLFNLSKIPEWRRIKVLKLIFGYIELTNEHLQLRDAQGRTLSDYYSMWLPFIPTNNRPQVIEILYELGHVEQFEASDNDDNRLVCQICFKHVKNVVLNCGHAFCYDCIKTNVELSANFHARCPYCAGTILNIMKLYL